jgi:hypothetical protein
MTMLVSRREALFSCGAMAFAGKAHAADAAGPRRRFVAGAMRGQQAVLAEFSTELGTREIVPMAGRAHQVMARRDVRGVFAVARRADRWALAVDLEAPDHAITIRPAEGHNFSGHVAPSPDGALAAFVEIRNRDAVGFLSVRESGTWREIARVETAGIGPHMALFVDDRHIAVANGGYYDVGDVKSPDGRIQASLAVIDRVSGQAAARVEAGRDYADYSLRHIAPAPEGIVAVLQRTADSLQETPPAAFWRAGALRPLFGPKPIDDPLRGYCSDVAIAGDFIIATSFTAGTVGAWRRGDGAFQGAFAHPFVGALAIDDRVCYAASQDGSLIGVACQPHPVATWKRVASVQWDNHGTFI